MGSGAVPKLFISEGSNCFPLILLLSVYIWSCFHGVECQSHLPLPNHEVEALRRIWLKLGQKWYSSTDPCTWVDPTSNEVVPGNVTCGSCDGSHCHVISIIIRRQNLTGSLPDEFGSLKHLQVIALTRNYLNGTIPVAWASLPLIKLSLLGNRISGRIPEELGNITSLKELVLQDNLMGGPIPTSLGKLINLEILHLSGNNFRGELPKALGNLKNLTELRIDGNPLSGQIPSFIGNWKMLKQLDMEGTSLEGPFPSSFSELESLNVLMVSSIKGGNGEFPPLENSRQLKIMVLRNLSISGALPDYIGNMANLILL